MKTMQNNWRCYRVPEYDGERFEFLPPDIRTILQLRAASSSHSGYLPETFQPEYISEAMNSLRQTENYVYRTSPKAPILGAMSLDYAGIKRGYLRLDSIAVLPEVRGNNIGALGLRAAALAGKKWRVDTIDACAVNTPQVLRFYGRYGLTPPEGSDEDFVYISGRVNEILAKTA